MDMENSKYSINSEAASSDCEKSNIILIGMPGCGKSTVGVVLAKNLGLRFMDSDICIQEQQNCLLHEIIARDGLEEFLAIENRVNASLEVNNYVIATGGSAVYGAKAMEHFKQIGTIVYLKLPYEDIKKRLGDLVKRGVALRDGQTLYDLYEERVPLYEQYADIIIDCHDKEIRDIVVETADRMREG